MKAVFLRSVPARRRRGVSCGSSLRAHCRTDFGTLTRKQSAHRLAAFLSVSYQTNRMHTPPNPHRCTPLLTPRHRVQYAKNSQHPACFSRGRNHGACPTAPTLVEEARGLPLAPLLLKGSQVECSPLPTQDPMPSTRPPSPSLSNQDVMATQPMRIRTRCRRRRRPPPSPALRAPPRAAPQGRASFAPCRAGSAPLA